MRNKNKKIKIGLLYGGPSSEHDVSIVSAAQVKKYLNRNKYEIVPIKISRSGVWPKGFNLLNLKKKIDIAFVVMHGSYGEDGTIQSLLKTAKVPYTSSGPLASALAMDKWRSGLLASQIGLQVPFSVLLNRNITLNGFKNKVVIKPNNGGSSIGVEILSKDELNKKLKSKTFQKADFIAQDYIAGRELTVSVIGNDQPSAFPPIEIVSKTKFYDYKAKYSTGGSEHIIPANISKDVTEIIQLSAVQMHLVLGCKGATRSDFILDKNNNVWYLETNTIPGMTSTSLLPQAAASVGIPFPELLDKIISLAS